ncbi:hypothetical protein GCM10007216_18240 [Thalassobacillus devorans]|uniref:DUF2584 domain-containing protein n=1 Tax=Thalassobacillus devorans TaxID=279813 RepID=A0ABQ1NZF7_9BACI|nr:DUF2584 family protein [Thalassobacillus devorans]NIK28232.1 hypothetical protein [Thalassobacillus devorans]GGC87848.1 hypothetical protein GCM10007216_18240 [Thalassobacillus devorans]
MSTPFSMEWKMITEGREKRINAEDNIFEITFDGYKIFPMEEMIEIKRHLDADLIGSGKVVELIFKNQQTTCKYQLISLYSVN